MSRLTAYLIIFVVGAVMTYLGDARGFVGFAGIFLLASGFTGCIIEINNR